MRLQRWVAQLYDNSHIIEQPEPANGTSCRARPSQQKRAIRSPASSPAQAYTMRVGGRVRDLLRRACRRGRHWFGWRDDVAAPEGIRLDTGGNLLRAGFASRPARPCRPVRSSPVHTLRPETRDGGLARADRRRDGGLRLDDSALAARRAVGRHRRTCRRPNHPRHVGDSRHALVRDAARPRHRPAVGRPGPWASLSSCPSWPGWCSGMAGAPPRLRCVQSMPSRGACCRLYPQPPVGRRPAPLWRRARCAVPGCGARARQPLPRSVRGARCRRAQTDVLDPSRIILRLRGIHQRPGSDAPNPDVWRLHDPRDGRGRHAGADGRVQFRRHGRLGLAHRSIQPPRPPLDLLRSARPVAVLPARVGLRSHSTRRLCGFLRPRLDHHCPADCEAHSRRLRACARHARIRLDLRVPPARGGAGRFHGRPHPHRTRLLHAGVSGRRHTMRGRRPGLRRRAPPRPACFHGGPRYILPRRIARSALAQPRAHAEKLGEPARSGRCPSSISPTRP